MEKLRDRSIIDLVEIKNSIRKYQTVTEIDNIIKEINDLIYFKSIKELNISLLLSRCFMFRCDFVLIYICPKKLTKDGSILCETIAVCEGNKEFSSFIGMKRVNFVQYTEDNHTWQVYLEGQVFDLERISALEYLKIHEYILD